MRRIAVLAAYLFISPAAGAATLTFSSDEWCPVNCAENDANPGYVIEVARRIFEPEGHSVHYVVRPWARALKETAVGVSTAIVGLSPEDDIERYFVTDATIARLTLSLFTLPNSTWTYSGEESLKQITLGVVRDYSYGPALEPYIIAYPEKIEVLHGERPFLIGLGKLRMGAIEAVVEDRIVAGHTAARAGIPIREAAVIGTPMPLRLGFTRANPDGARYAAQFSRGIEELRRSGELARILERYGVSDWENAGTPARSGG